MSQQISLPPQLQSIHGLLYSPTNTNLSGQMAIAASLATPDKLKQFKVKSRAKGRLENKLWFLAALDIATQLGIKEQMSISQFQSVVDRWPDKRVVIFSLHTNQPLFNGRFIGATYDPESAEESTIWILFDAEETHFTWILNMQAYFRSVMTRKDHVFCAKCIGWIRKWKFETHRCIYEFRCIDCGEHNLKTPGELMDHRDKNVHGTESCPRCSKDVSARCLEKHVAWCQGKSLVFIQCHTCLKKYATEWDHKCYHKWCSKCKLHYPEQTDHRCFLGPDPYRRSLLEDEDQPLGTITDLEEDSDLEERPIKRMKENSTHFAYDIESMLTSTAQPDGTSKDLHTVVLIVVRQLYCESEDESSYHVFRNLDTFFGFALQQKRSYFWAHNAQGYDSQLLFSYVMRHSTLHVPKNIIFRGEKILQFCVKSTKFRDSMCHLPTSLDSIPKMLGLTGNWKKGFFPHKFNTPEHQEYIGPMPPREYYEPEAMKEDRLKVFEAWYAEESLQGMEWNFQEQLLSYCRSDTLLLARGLEKYDELMRDLNRDISPLTNVTLASYALTVFRNLHLTPNSIVELTKDEFQFAKGALHGGKTDVRILHREWSPDQVAQGTYGCYVDVQSMYPFVQYTRPIPCGVPVWKTFHEGDGIDMDFLESCIGIIECDIKSTQYLHHPIIGGKDPKTQKYVFDLKPKERLIVTSVELQLALKHGYVVTRLYKALLFKDQQILFKSYIEKFLKIKLEASGVPKVAWETFAKRHKEALGIELDPSKMIRNEGLRAMAKLMLNSLWGKLGQDPNLPHNVFIDNETKYKDLLQKEYRGEISITQNMEVTQNKSLISYKDSEGTLDLQNKNVVTAAFVAAYGRIHLWETLHFLGERVLYHDTDSVVYEHSRDGPNVTIGYMLGEWEDELEENDCITSFVALGPKTYSFVTRMRKESIKCKGFSLNVGNRKSINHDKMIEILKDSKTNSDSCLVLSDRKFQWDRTNGQYWSYLQSKTMRFTADKNEIDWETYTTTPFQ